MSTFDSILVLRNASPRAPQAERCAAWIADELGAKLHVHSLPENRAILGAIAEHAAKLVVSAGQVVENCPVPVLVLPTSYREALPWRSMFVAASGERAADQALEAAVMLANELHLNVTVAHCEDARSAGAPLGAYADAPQYEYPGRMDEMLRGLLRHTPAERGCIHRVLLCRGDAATQLLGELEEHESSVLALGWHGAFAASRAPVLRRLLDDAPCALLIVRRFERAGVRLKVGNELDAA